MTGLSVSCAAIHDGQDLLQIVDVEGWYAVAVFGGVVQHLAQGNKSHRDLQKFMTNRALGHVAIGLVAIHSVALSSRQ